MKRISEMTMEELDALDLEHLPVDQLREASRRAKSLLSVRERNGNEFTGDLTKLNEVAKVDGVDDNWVWGAIDGYTFEAKVFANGSMFGINKGRISKLCVRKGDDEVVAYDRGWATKPSGEVTETYNKILKALQ